MAENISSIKVGVDSAPAAKGAAEVNKALQSIERSLRTLQKTIAEVNKAQAGAGGAGAGAGGEVAKIAESVPKATDQLQAFMSSLNKIRNTLFVVYLLREAFDGLTVALRTLIQTGFEFNAVMEQAVVGTGGLIAQIGGLERKGIKLEGVESIRAGMQLAKEEVLQLQIAGLQTAATSTALVNAFQQAVGPGLAAGLALKQIRDLTVDIVQVATAIGLPMHQIAQEVRAIVEGTIDPNARVAKVLQIDNATIQKMKESGKLAEFLFQKLDKFRAIGPIIEKTWSGVTSNLQEFGEVLSGLATQPLFEKLTESLVRFNEQLREGGAGKNADELKDLFAPDIQAGIANVQKAFEELGTQADRVLLVILDRARDMLEVFGETGKVETLQEAIKRLGDEVVDMLNRADVKTWVRDVIDGFNDVSKAFKEVRELTDYVNRGLRILGETIIILLTPLTVLLNLMRRPAPGQSFGDWVSRALTDAGDMAVAAAKNMKDAWEGIEPSNVMENAAERATKAFGVTKLQIDSAAQSTEHLTSEFGRLFEIGKAGEAATGQNFAKLFAIGKGGLDLALKRAEDKADVKPTKPPPKVDKGAADKAAREAERQAAKERAFQLAKLQLYEQTARDAVGLQNEMNKILLNQNEEAYAREIISLDQYEKKRKALLMAGAAGERDIALVRIKGAALAGAKALSQIMTLPNFREALEAANYEDVRRFITELEDKKATIQTQEQAEALREMTQAAYDLASALLRVKSARGDFELDRLPVIKRREPIDLVPPAASEQIAMAANLRLEREKILELAREEAAIQRALTYGQITQAEAAERMADQAERANQFEIERLQNEIDNLNVVTQATEKQEKMLKLIELQSRVFRVSNSEAFFKGLNENIDKLSDKFQKLGEDIRSIFRDAFEELGRTGFRGFVDTFLQGIADALNTRAADALSQIVTKILTDIFKPGGGGQSIFDKLIEQLLSIFGRTPTGTFSIGGVLEKIFGKLLDPLGRKKQGDLPIQGAPKGLPQILEDLRKQTPDERTQALITTLDTTVSGIYRDTTDMAQSLRELKACCAEHNSLLKQQMANAAKGPSLLGQILNAAVGAAIGGAIGSIGQGEGNLTGYPGSEGDLPYPSERPPGFFPTPGGGIPPLTPPWLARDPNSNLASVTTNITIQTPNPAAFNAPQTQAQIGSLVYSNIQKAQTLVPAITNPNAVNK